MFLTADPGIFWKPQSNIEFGVSLALLGEKTTLQTKSTVRITEPVDVCFDKNVQTLSIQLGICSERLEEAWHIAAALPVACESGYENELPDFWRKGPKPLISERSRAH